MNKVIIFCSDPRVKTANLWKHIKTHIIPQGQRWAPIAIFGGPISLARSADLPSDFACLIGQINFALKQFSPDGIVVVGHDCGYYKRIAERPFGIHEKVDDIIVAASFLARRHGLPVEAFFKRENAGFDKLCRR